MGYRQEPRIELNAFATLCGVDAHGRSFMETVLIRNISGRGVLLEAERCLAKQGDTVVLRCANNRGRFQVMWVVGGEPERTVQIGLQHALPTPLFWGLDLPVPAPDPYFRTRVAARRRNRRYTTELPVEVRVNAKVPIWSSTANVSEGGCFVHMLNTLPLFTRLDIAFWVGQVKYWAEGMVVSSIGGSGSGIRFLAMSDEARLRLRQAIELGSEAEDRRAVPDAELAWETSDDSLPGSADYNETVNA